MPRSRNIKPGFFQNDELVELDFSIRLLFIGLWTIADREGRLENRPKKIKMQLFPADELDMHGALDQLAKKGLISLYSVDSVEYIEIDNFLKHQHPHIKEQASTIPAPDMHHACPSDSLNPITDSFNPQKREVKQVYPKELNIDAWNNYLEYRKEAKFKKLQKRSEELQIEKLIGYGSKNVQRDCINETISNGWQGIFEPKNGNGKSKADSHLEAIRNL